MSARRVLDGITTGRVIYHFHPGLDPAWRAAPGEKLTVRCPDGMRGRIQSEEDHYEQVDPDRVNDAVGPIHVVGAEPGDALIVNIEEIRVPADQGYVLLIPGFGLLKDMIREARTRICPIEGGFVHFRERRIPLDPCIGTIGVAPAEGRVSTIYPGDHGGNLDTTLVRAGNRLFLPVRQPGALLAMGDGKAVMGDGEVCGTGVGVPLEVDCYCEIARAVPIERPWVETSSDWVCLASAPTLEEAVRVATLDVIAALQRAESLSFQDAYMLASLVGHLAISQVVDPWMTARMAISKLYLTGLGRGEATVAGH